MKELKELYPAKIEYMIDIHGDAEISAWMTRRRNRPNTYSVHIQIQSLDELDAARETAQSAAGLVKGGAVGIQPGERVELPVER